MKKSWYSAKCIFRHLETESRRQIYEERIVLLKAKDSDTAIKKAEKNAIKYCEDIEDCEPAGLIDVFELYDEIVGDKTEIFSSIQSNELSPEDYLSQFYPDTPDDCETSGQTHRWYKKDGRHDGCYHCRVTRNRN